MSPIDFTALRDEDGTFVPDPNCPHCDGTGTAPDGAGGTLACNCHLPVGVTDWLDVVLVDLYAAGSLREVARILERRGVWLHGELDRAKRLRREAAQPVVPQPTETWAQYLAPTEYERLRAHLADLIARPAAARPMGEPEETQKRLAALEREMGVDATAGEEEQRRMGGG